MDYEFTLDEYDKPIAEFSMGHEALGRWFSEEMGDDPERVEELLDIVDQLDQRRVDSRQLFGEDFQLRLNQDRVEAIALALDVDEEHVLPEDTQLYNDESYAECGLPDFKQALLAWQLFVSE